MGGGGEPAGASPTTAQIAWRLLPLYFTHINQALLTTLPFTVAVYMVRDFEAEKSGGAAVGEQTIGRLTGLLAAMFCAAQLVTSFPWGLVSDCIGRKPVLVIGNISCVVSVLLFGLSGSYWQALVARAAGGALNAIILVEKAMIGEGLPTKDSQAKAFGLMSLCWGVGSLAGPLVGGALSSPCRGALRVEAFCREGALFAFRPYFLPCLVAGVLSAVATVMTIFGLEETLPSRRRGPPMLGGAGSGGSKAGYSAVPTAEAARQLPGQHGQELELGGLARRGTGGGSSSSEAGARAWGGSSDGSSGKEASPRSSAGKAASSSPKVRPFRGDSAHFSSPLHSSGSTPQHEAAIREEPPLGGSGSRAVSRSGSGELDFVVYGPDDLERGPGQQQEQQEHDALLPGGQHGSAAAASTAAGAATAAEHAGVLPWYRQRAVILSLCGYGLIAFFYNMIDEVTPIFASATVPDGGLGFAPAELAPSLSFSGLVLVCWALKGFPWLMKRVGVVRACRYGLWQTAPLALLIPCTSLFRGARLPSQALMLLTLGAKAITATNAFTACLILVNATAPKQSLGAVNGAGQSLASLVRALGPALGGLTWGWSSQLAHQAWWPAWLPHQFVPFGLAALLIVGTDFVYRGLRMPDSE